MKKSALNFVILLGMILLASCGGQIRLTETESIGKDAVKNSVCENDDIKISYDMWGENGIMYFSLYNKTDKPMYIDWKRSVFIYNDWKNNYWVEKTTTESYLVPSGAGRNITYSNKVSMVTAERVTFIPPKTYVSVPMTYVIFNNINQVNTAKTGDNKVSVLITDNLKMDKTATKVKIPSTTGKGNVEAYQKTFTTETTPARFRNFLTYSSNENFSTEKYIENEFIISKYTQMSTKNFFGKATKVKVTAKTFGSKYNAKVNVYDSPYKNGSSFYKTLIQVK
jgi:hypothetical protein